VQAALDADPSLCDCNACRGTWEEELDRARAEERTLAVTFILGAAAEAEAMDGLALAALLRGMAKQLAHDDHARED
jgi:hypothetical protein